MQLYKNRAIIACEACDEILPYFIKSNSSNEGNNNNNNRKRKVSNLDSLQYLDSSSKVIDKNIISIICQVCTYNNEIRVSNISTEELKCEIFIWDPSIDKIDFQNYEKFRVDDIGKLSPDIVVFGNDGMLFDDYNLQNFLNQLPNSSFVIDYWGILNKLRIKRINSFSFGQG